MNISIRKEEPKDYRLVEELTREAFWNLYFPGAHEHYVVHKIRQHPDFIPELSFVIELEHKVQGAIFFSHSKIISAKSPTTIQEYAIISFGPVLIAPKFHRLGLGKELINFAIAQAKNMGYKAILTLGYPYHYRPYGFVGGKKYNITMEDGKFYTGLLALPLYENALLNCEGYAKFSDVFDVSQEEVDEFDKTFPYKEKKNQASQEEYELACGELDE